MNVKVKRIDKNTYIFIAGIGEYKTCKLPYEITEEMYGFTEYQWKHFSDIIRRIWRNEKKDLWKNRKRKATGHHKTHVDDSCRS